MKTRFLKSTVTLLLVCALAFSLTGCDSLDYREAIKLYNAGKYDQAAALFSELDEYEDSAALHTRSLYWAAITRMEEGNYPEALPRFQKLGNYSDSTQRATECTYQIALAAFEEGNFADAEMHFRELDDYRFSREYLRRIHWQKLFDAVMEVGTESGGIYTIATQAGQHSVSIMADPSDSPQLLFTVSWEKNTEYAFRDHLTLTMTRDSLEAVFTAGSSFTMDYLGSQIGSQQAARGCIDLSTCTPDTVLVIDSLSKSVIDNQGNTSTSEDPADATLTEDMQENYRILMTTLPQLLAEAGIGLTLQDIGFSAL